jgi:hypothetical protein
MERIGARRTGKITLVPCGAGELIADQEVPTPKVFAAVPDGYWDLPEDERLAAAEQLAAQFQEWLPHSS